MRNPSCSSSNYGFVPKKATTTPCCSKIGIKRGPWTPEEDELLSNYVNKEGEGRWRTLPKRAGLLRCGKSCRLRWMNYLRPSVKRGRIAPDEEDLILRLHRLLGNRWSLIAGRIPGRTDNEIKNYWNTHLSKKLISQGIDPTTHKPLNPNPSSSQNTQFLDQDTAPKFSHFQEINQERAITTKVSGNFNMGNDLNNDHHHEFQNNIPIVNHDGIIDNWSAPSYINDAEGQNNGDNFYVGSQNQNHEDHFSLFLDSLINENENLFLNQNHHFLQQEQQQQQYLQQQLQLQREQEQQNPNLLAPITQPIVSTQQAFINNSTTWETDLLSSVSAALNDEDVALN